jgi:putative DNA primase/helicase
LSAEPVQIDWRKGLACKNGRATAETRNWIHALRAAPELRGLVCFDEFARRLVFGKPAPWRDAKPGDHWENQDDTWLAKWLEDRDILTAAKLPSAIEAVAREHPVHPVREYLKALRHDGRPRLDTWLTKYLGAAAAEPYLRAVGRKFLVSAVARIFEPGCQVDHTLVLEGPQGSGKTTVTKVLAVRDEWHLAELHEMTGEEAARRLAGKWIVELAELAALRRTDIEKMKSFLTRTHDDIRAPYQRRYEQAPRQAVFCGSTNERCYLRDSSGNRRFWPVACGRIDLEGLRRDRDHLWAEAVALYRAKAMWHLTAEEADLAAYEQRERMFVSELEVGVAQYLERMRQAGTTETDIGDVLVHALRLDPDAPDYTERAQRLGPQVAVAMEAAGWRKVGRSKEGGVRRTVYRHTQGGQDAQG